MSKIYEHPWYAAQLELESTTTSDAPSKLKPRPETTGPKSTSPPREGGKWELWVKFHAIERGAECYDNILPCGKTDLIIEWQGQLLKCDVKQMTRAGRNMDWCPRGIDKIADGTWQVCVHPETRAISWPPKYTPPGWEDFWNQSFS